MQRRATMTRPTPTDREPRTKAATRQHTVAGHAVRPRRVRAALAQPAQRLRRNAPSQGAVLTVGFSLPFSDVWPLGILLTAALASLVLLAVAPLVLYQPWSWGEHSGLLFLVLSLAVLGLSLRALSSRLPSPSSAFSLPRLVTTGLTAASWFIMGILFILDYQRADTDTLGFMLGARNPVLFALLGLMGLASFAVFGKALVMISRHALAADSEQAETLPPERGYDAHTRLDEAPRL